MTLVFRLVSRGNAHTGIGRRAWLQIGGGVRCASQATSSKPEAAAATRAESEAEPVKPAASSTTVGAAEVSTVGGTGSTSSKSGSRFGRALREVSARQWVTTLSLGTAGALVVAAVLYDRPSGWLFEQFQKLKALYLSKTDPNYATAHLAEAIAVDEGPSEAEIEAEKAAQAERELEEARLAEQQERERIAAAHAAALADAGAKAAAVAGAAIEKAEQARRQSEEQRQVAMNALREALESRDNHAISEALGVARSAGIGATAETRTADAIVGPRRMVHEGLGEQDLAELLQLPQRFRGVTEEEARAVEFEACASMDRQELEARVVELSRYLATSRLHARAWLEQALDMKLQAADAASLRDLEEALARKGEEHDEATARQLEELQVSLHKQHEEAVTSAVQTAVAEAQERLNAQEQQLREAAQAAITEAGTARLKEVVVLNSGLARVEEALAQDETLVKEAHAYTGLTVALAGFEDAMVAGKSAARELEVLQEEAKRADSVVAGMLAKLPKGSVELCRQNGVLPTPPLLRYRLKAELEEWITAALVPPCGGLLGEVSGRLLGRLYVWLPSAVLLSGIASAGEGEGSTEAERNLSVLNRVATPLISGSYAGPQAIACSLAQLENSLEGLCRQRAAAWIAEARDVLTLHQTIWAVKARVQCLNSKFL